MEKDDSFIIIQWLDRCGDGLYELTDTRDCVWEIESIIPVKRLGTYKHTRQNEEEADETFAHFAPYKLQPLIETEIRAYCHHR